MDVPTRVGLGSTALFTLAGISAPILTWWVSAPIMAACAVVAAWGFWPLFASRISRPKATQEEATTTRRKATREEATNTKIEQEEYISLKEAALRACEQLQHSEASIWAEASADSNDDILTWYCVAMAMPRDGKPPLISLRGNKSPSRLVEPIDLRLFSNFDFAVENGSIILKERMGKRRFENLLVSAKEVAAAIGQIKGWKV